MEEHFIKNKSAVHIKQTHMGTIMDMVDMDTMRMVKVDMVILDTGSMD